MLIQIRNGQKEKSDQDSVHNEITLGKMITNDRNDNLTFKHKLEKGSPTGHASKRQRIDRSESTDGITEDAVRRYLMRKPMTATDLLLKFKNKLQQRDNLVESITAILKKLNPEKQTIKGKLYFSLKHP